MKKKEAPASGRKRLIRLLEHAPSREHVADGPEAARSGIVVHVEHGRSKRAAELRPSFTAQTLRAIYEFVVGNAGG